jgi:hypothetical protein
MSAGMRADSMQDLSHLNSRQRRKREAEAFNAERAPSLAPPRFPLTDDEMLAKGIQTQRTRRTAAHRAGVLAAVMALAGTARV